MIAFNKLSSLFGPLIFQWLDSVKSQVLWSMWTVCSYWLWPLHRSLSFQKQFDQHAICFPWSSACDQSDGHIFSVPPVSSLCYWCWLQRYHSPIHSPTSAPLCHKHTQLQQYCPPEQSPDWMFTQDQGYQSLGLGVFDSCPSLNSQTIVCRKTGGDCINKLKTTVFVCVWEAFSCPHLGSRCHVPHLSGAVIIAPSIHSCVWFVGHFCLFHWQLLSVSVNRACKWVTIHGVTLRDWRLLGTKRH